MRIITASGPTRARRQGESDTVEISAKPGWGALEVQNARLFREREKQELEIPTQAQSQFLPNMSHDLCTPPNGSWAMPI
jgi:hypothetical protein